MPDLLKQGAAWLNDQRHQHLTRTVVYRRGTSSVDVQATIGSTAFRIDDDTGASIVSISRDYLVRTTDLVLDGSPALPRRGDQIEDDDGQGQTHVHEVMAPGGEPEWRYSDPQRSTLRIHTKEISIT